MRLKLLAAFSVVTSWFSSTPCIGNNLANFQPLIEHALNDATLGYEVRLWFQKLHDGDLRDATHRWSTVKTEIPKKYRFLADAVYTVALKELDLPSTMMAQLIQTTGKDGFSESEPGRVLEKIVGNEIAKILDDSWVVLNQNQRTATQTMSWSGSGFWLKTWAGLRDPADAAKALAKLPKDHAWRKYLVFTVGLNFLRNNQLRDAVKIFEFEYQNTDSSSSLRPTYALSAARAYYQMADLKNSLKYYELVDRKSPEYPMAQEELLWVHLRTGDMKKVRQIATDLTSLVTEEIYQPESQVVRAVSFLKLCDPDNVKSSFDLFLSENQKWAKSIETANLSDSPVAPSQPDWFVQGAKRAITARKTELESAQKLLEESIVASLPAVGKQSHWQDVVTDLNSEIVFLNKVNVSESKRQWRHYGKMMDEALRKQKFVRVELLSQAGALDGEGGADAAVVDDSSGSYQFGGVSLSKDASSLTKNAKAYCM